MHKRQKNGVPFGPGEASDTSAVTVSALRQNQNVLRLNWSSAEIDERLKKDIKEIHAEGLPYGNDGREVDYIKGANVGVFVETAGATCAYGTV